MFKSNKLIYILVIFLVVSVTGCQNKPEEISASGKYISYTVTAVNDDESLEMTTFAYDLDDDSNIGVSKMEYNAQYPLTAYDKKNNKVYYSSRIDDADNLFELDLKTGNTKQLTDSLFAINYIIPVDNELYLVAVENGERAMGLFKFVNNKLERIFDDVDAFVWKVNYNPDLQTLVFNTYSQSELDKNMEEPDDGTPRQGKNTIWTLNTANNEFKKVATTKPGYITDISMDEEGNIYYCMGYFYQVKDNGESQKNSEFNDLGILSVIYNNNKYLYYISNEGTLNKYSKDEKNITVLYETSVKKCALNNAIILFSFTNINE